MDQGILLPVQQSDVNRREISNQNYLRFHSHANFSDGLQKERIWKKVMVDYIYINSEGTDSYRSRNPDL